MFSRRFSRWKRDPVVSASDSPSGGPSLESRSGHLQDLLDSVAPSVQSSVTFVNSQLVAFWQVLFYFILFYFFLNSDFFFKLQYLNGVL